FPVDLWAVPVRPTHLGLRRWLREPGRRVARGAAGARQAAVPVPRPGAVAVRLRGQRTAARLNPGTRLVAPLGCPVALATASPSSPRPTQVGGCSAFSE